MGPETLSLLNNGGGGGGGNSLALDFNGSSKAGDIRTGSNYMSSGGGNLGIVKTLAILGVVFLVYRMGRK